VLALSLFARQKGKSNMSSPSRSLLAGAILFVASLTAAEAADLGGNRDLSYAPMPAAFAPSPTWYLRGDVGYAWMDASDLAANSLPSPPSLSTIPGVWASALAPTRRGRARGLDL